MTDYWPEATETLKNLISSQHLVYKLEPPRRYTSCMGYPRRDRTGICIENDHVYLEIEFLADTIVFYKWGAGITPTYNSCLLAQPDSIDQILQWLRENNIKLIDDKVQQILT